MKERLETSIQSLEEDRRTLSLVLARGNKNKPGFTLIELMIVVIIVAVLATAAVPIYALAVKKAYMSEARAALDAIRTAELVYHTEHRDFLAVAVGNLANPEDDANPGLGTDVTQNTWFNEAGAFSVVVTKDVGGDPLADKFQARCDGSALTGNQPDVVKSIRICLDSAGNWGGYDGTTGTWPSY